MDARISIAIASIFLIVLNAEAFGIKDCGGELGNSYAIDISNATVNETGYEIRRGTNYSFYVKFTAEHDMNRLMAKIDGLVDGESRPIFHLGGIPANNLYFAKNGTKTQFPLEGGEELYIYNSTFFVSPNSPLGPLFVRLELIDGKDVKIVCSKMPAQMHA